MWARRFMFVAGMLVVGAACDSATAPASSDHVVGILEWHAGSGGSALAGIAEPAETRVVAPDTVDAGTPFDISVRTIGRSGCWSQAGAESAVTGMLATVTPYDRVTTSIDGEPAFCTGALVDLERTVSIAFASPGTATLRVNGRIVMDGELDGTQPVTVEKQIFVRE
jgi:hypothetical protein